MSQKSWTILGQEGGGGFIKDWMGFAWDMHTDGQSCLMERLHRSKNKAIALVLSNYQSITELSCLSETVQCKLGNLHVRPMTDIIY